MLRTVNRLIALSLGTQREQLEHRTKLTWPRPDLLRLLDGDERKIEGGMRVSDIAFDAYWNRSRATATWNELLPRACRMPQVRIDRSQTVVWGRMCRTGMVKNDFVALVLERFRFGFLGHVKESTPMVRTCRSGAALLNRVAGRAEDDTGRG